MISERNVFVQQGPSYNHDIIISILLLTPVLWCSVMIGVYDVLLGLSCSYQPQECTLWLMVPHISLGEGHEAGTVISGDLLQW